MKDGISGNPVFVADMSSLMMLFSSDEIDFFKSDYTGKMPDSLRSVFRLLPCNTVNGGGLLPGFAPHRVSVGIGKKVCLIPKVVIALTTEKLADGEYDILLNKNIYDYQWREKDYDEKSYVSANKSKD
jgi:hypothetical protein